MKLERDVPIREIGENRVVARFRELASAASGKGVLVGSGDDAAVVSVAENRLLLLTCDMMVEGIHFRRDWASAEQIGWKAMVQNVSDIAAMGGEPAFAVASFAAPGTLSGQVVEEIAEGLVAAASEYGVALVGGDLVGSHGPIVVDVALTGWVEKETMLLRRGVRAGDAVCVTSSLGASAAGLAALQRGLPREEMPELDEVLSAHREPRPRLAEGRAIARTGLANAMMDLSDGLTDDLPRLGAASGVGIRVDADRVPIDPSCAAVAARLGLDALALATAGGEDYELLFTCPRQAVNEIASAVASETGTSVTVIGEAFAGEGAVLVDAAGESRPFATGFDHFGNSSHSQRAARSESSAEG